MFFKTGNVELAGRIKGDASGNACSETVTVRPLEGKRQSNFLKIQPCGKSD